MLPPEKMPGTFTAYLSSDNGKKILENQFGNTDKFCNCGVVDNCNLHHHRNCMLSAKVMFILWSLWIEQEDVRVTFTEAQLNDEQLNEQFDQSECTDQYDNKGIPLHEHGILYIQAPKCSSGDYLDHVALVEYKEPQCALLHSNVDQWSMQQWLLTNSGDWFSKLENDAKELYTKYGQGNVFACQNATALESVMEEMCKSGAFEKNSMQAQNHKILCNQVDYQTTDDDQTAMTKAQESQGGDKESNEGEQKSNEEEQGSDDGAWI